MITFKQFITEETINEAVIKDWFSNPIEVEEAINLLNTEHKDGLKAIQNGSLIYRGFSKLTTGKTGFVQMDSSTGERTSRDTDNLYQVMMATSKGFQGYPDRGKSFICTTSVGTAQAYAAKGDLEDIMVMIPKDGTKIAYLQVNDIFDVYLSGLLLNRYSVDSLSSVTRFIEIAGYKHGESKTFTDISKIDAALAQHDAKKLLLLWDLKIKHSSKRQIAFDDKVLQNSYVQIPAFQDHVKIKPSLIDKFYKEMTAGNFTIVGDEGKMVLDIFKKNPSKPFTALSSAIINPKTLGAKLTTFGSKLPKNVECWFSGPCIAITGKVFGMILKQLNDQGQPINKTVANDFKRLMK